MLMVILGAGASYDSCADRPPDAFPGESARPPLANYLFAAEHLDYRNFRRQFPQFQDVLAELVPRKGRSVEDALYRLQNEIGKNPKRLQQLTAIRFYLQELLTFLAMRWLDEIGNFSNYNALLDQIQNHIPGEDPVLLVTFNYDTLLESALIQHLGVTFDTVHEYLDHSRRFKLFKLHGSVDWAHPVLQRPTMMDTATGGIIANVARLTISNDINTRKAFGGTGVLYPAIAIPVKDKSDFECPNFHVAQLEQQIPKVTKVLTIGWRGMEKHFLRILGKLNPVSVAVVAGSDVEAAETLKQLRDVPISFKTEERYAGFSDTLGDRRLDGFLAA